jgi:hypothetical protein
MMRVRCILVETTLPVRMRPRIDTMPVKGHFLSAWFEGESALCVLLGPSHALSQALGKGLFDDDFLGELKFAAYQCMTH